MNHNSRSDQALLDQYFAGNREAVSTLIERHRRRISDYIYMLVKDRSVADDIFQETLIKVMKFLDEGRYTESGRFLSWVLRIAHNQVIDHFRHTRQQSQVNESDAGYDILNSHRFSDRTVEDSMVTAQVEEEVRQLIGFLPEEQKEVVLLRYFNGLSFKEIADQTDVSINTALGRMRYALINLRKLMQEKRLVLT
jgi:RNA polymerase sigma-70 factor (ECF subfamily)